MAARWTRQIGPRNIYAPASYWRAVRRRVIAGGSSDIQPEVVPSVSGKVCHAWIGEAAACVMDARSVRLWFQTGDATSFGALRTFCQMHRDSTGCN
jgi:hypothetical protein